jgi:alkylation response protein AidB-like acyl-CoA dehydrogenase
MQFFDISRAYVAAHGVGLAQGALDMAVKHVKGREQFGQKIAAFQAIQFKIADMATKIELARTLTHKACSLLDKGKPDSQVTCMAKMFSGRVAVEVVDEALQLHGGYGYFNDEDVERFYRSAKVLEIYEGAKEIEKMVIGRGVLGKY